MPAAPTPRAGASGTWPLWFEPAPGDSGTFVAHGAGYQLALSARGASLAFGTAPVQIAFDGGRAVRPVGIDRTGGVSHHYIGNDPAAWRRDVPHFARVRYPEVYPGIDVLFYAAPDDSQATRLEYDFVVAPGANPNRIALRFVGASSLEVLEDGSLAARVGDRAVLQRAPVAFQDIDGARRAVDVAFTLRGDTVVFTLGAYDPRHTLTIDPIVVVFGTFVGGSGDEFVDTSVSAENGSIAVNASGATYLASDSTSASVLGVGAPTGSGTNVLVAKLGPTGPTVEFVTFLGGSGEEARARLALDEDGNIMVVGRTRSTDLLVPSPNAVKSTPPAGGVDDGFLVKLNSLGMPTYATYLGGSGSDTVEALAVRGGMVAVTGVTNSTAIPLTANAAQATLAGSFDAWVAVIDPDATPALVYGSYLGGSGLDFPKGVALDASGRVKAILTRDDDTFVELDERRAFAERHKAALFMAIHADYAGSRASGATIYSLRDRVADELQRSASGEVIRDVLSDKELQAIRQVEVADTNVIRGFLADLAQREVAVTHERTNVFARSIIEFMGDATPMMDNPDRTAAFRVLKTAKVPAVLVELAYVTNRQDAANLKSDSWRKKVAESLVTAIDNYFTHQVARLPM